MTKNPTGRAKAKPLSGRKRSRLKAMGQPLSPIIKITSHQTKTAEKFIEFYGFIEFIGFVEFNEFIGLKNSITQGTP